MLPCPAHSGLISMASPVSGSGKNRVGNCGPLTSLLVPSLCSGELAAAGEVTTPSDDKKAASDLRLETVRGQKSPLSNDVFISAIFFRSNHLPPKETGLLRTPVSISGSEAQKKAGANICAGAHLSALNSCSAYRYKGAAVRDDSPGLPHVQKARTPYQSQMPARTDHAVIPGKLTKQTPSGPSSRAAMQISFMVCFSGDGLQWRRCQRFGLPHSFFFFGMVCRDSIKAGLDDP